MSQAAERLTAADALTGTVPTPLTEQRLRNLALHTVGRVVGAYVLAGGSKRSLLNQPVSRGPSGRPM